MMSHIGTSVFGSTLLSVHKNIFFLKEMDNGLKIDQSISYSNGEDSTHRLLIYHDSHEDQQLDITTSSNIISVLLAGVCT